MILLAPVLVVFLSLFVLCFLVMLKVRGALEWGIAGWLLFVRGTACQGCQRRSCTTVVGD